MFTVHQGNRLETLADRLADLLRTPVAGPLTPEVVVVQNNGMARWLAMRIATQLGLCASVRFPLPAAFVWEVFRATLPAVPEVSGLEPAVATWHLMALRPALRGEPVFAPLAPHLRDGEDLRHWELARRIADVFDQYLVYRPDWIRAWEEGGGSGWQPELWRRLVARAGGAHRVALAGAFLRLETPALARATLPARVALFGIPAMPPAYLAILLRLAEVADVHLFLLNPCREYWGQIVPERTLPRVAAGREPSALYFEVGNALLASLGRQGRDFVDLIQEHAPARDERDCFEPPPRDTLLRHVQADILDLRDAQRDGAPAAIAAEDRSVQVHACHAPMREAEVLHDQLLALFAAHPDLTPADVVVMTPDIETYAPCIETVFEAAPKARRIPVTIADRSVRAESGLADAFLTLLELPESRYEAGRLLALLEADGVRRRFAMTDTDLGLVHRWARASGIRWGVDAPARAALDLPAMAEHTWRFGLDRLLLGWAMAGDEAGRLFAGVLPLDDVEGTQARTAGLLASFAEAAFALPERLAAPRAVAAWSETLGAVLEDFFAPEGDDDERAAQAVRGALAAMADAAARAACVAPVSLAVVRAHLRRELERPVRTGRFLAGSVTVCAMVPMRSIPFEVVCCVGMNDGAFPRAPRPPGFDAMAAAPRRGDRNRRDDDRYLFLEAVLSARRCLYVSYVGSSIRDNKEIPPSVVVSELLDYLRRGYGREAVIRHPLQGFSRRYFQDDPALVSFAEERCAAAEQAGRPDRTAAPFIVRSLPEPGEEWATVDIARLVEFFRNPARFLLQRRLGIRIEEQEGLVESREPFGLEGLERWKVCQWLAAHRLSGAPLAGALAVLRARGTLPHGRVGEVLFDDCAERVEAFARRVEAARGGTTPARLAVDCDLGPLRLTGTLDDLCASGLVAWRCAKVKAKDRVALWVRHLVLGCIAPEGVARESRWVGDDRTVVFRPAGDPRALLRDLIACYRDGLRRPLPFMPETSLVAARTGSLEKARATFDNERNGEGSDPYVELAFRGADPIGPALLDLARGILGPLREHEVTE